MQCFVASFGYCFAHFSNPVSASLTNFSGQHFCRKHIFSSLWFILFFLLLAVIATMRDLKRKDKLVEAAGDAYGTTLSLAVLDVCSDESVKQCIDGIKDRHVDILSESKDSPFKTLPVDHTSSLFLSLLLSSHPDQSTTQESVWWVRLRAFPLRRWKKFLRPISLGSFEWSRRWCLIWREEEGDTSSWSVVWWVYKVRSDTEGCSMLQRLKNMRMSTG